MIIDAILLVLKVIVEILLAPFTVINIAVDFVASIPVVMSFLQVVAYVLPWGNILPVIILVFAIFVFRIIVSLVNLLLKFIPFFG